MSYSNDEYIKKYTFKTKDHTFIAIVDTYDDTIRVGGKYKKCVLITANLNGNKTLASLDHVQSEPECTLDAHLGDNQTADMIRSSLLFCKHIYPDTQYVELSDASHIDCKKSKGGKPPRKVNKPLSLAHLMIATSKQTWYERILNAQYKHESLQSEYVKNLAILDTRPHMSFDDFSKINNLSTSQKDGLQPFFIDSTSWYTFFNSIPKPNRCDMFYNWLPTFVNYLIKNSFNSEGWIVNIDKMPPADISNISEVNSAAEGGKRRKTTRKTKRGDFTMSNAKTKHRLAV